MSSSTLNPELPSDSDNQSDTEMSVDFPDPSGPLVKVKINTGGMHHRGIHANLLCAVSKFFAKELKNRADELELPSDTEPAVLWLFGDRLYAMADMEWVPYNNYKLSAITSFESPFHANFFGRLKAYVFAQKYGIDKFATAIFDSPYSYISGDPFDEEPYVDEVQYIFQHNSQHDMLRSLLCDHVTTYILSEGFGASDRAKWENLAKTCPQFGSCLIRNLTMWRKSNVKFGRDKPLCLKHLIRSLDSYKEAMTQE
ncbi:hypothetical protein QBC38DRAFT_524410 [Podospora fimiseda]|uniref:Uncharacterized protein n=1 Tax=Podospora fimiseda TaxID=252190 RepID=A0AAN7BS00_9PEZI|nr:hypothetical protein QBC38DRAFT_524410 [Podospora fimiseda]